MATSDFLLIVAFNRKGEGHYVATLYGTEADLEALNGVLRAHHDNGRLQMIAYAGANRAPARFRVGSLELPQGAGTGSGAACKHLETHLAKAMSPQRLSVRDFSAVKVRGAGRLRSAP